MGVHESQSLFWERYVFQSREFWDFLTPLVHKHFPHTVGVSSEEFYLYCNQVSPGFIRVDADEVNYYYYYYYYYNIIIIFITIIIGDISTTYYFKI